MTRPWSGPAGGDQQVLPLQGIAGGAETVGTGELDERIVEGANLVGVVGDAVVHRDRRSVVPLEVVAELLGRGEVIDADGLPSSFDVVDAVAEQFADVGLVAPKYSASTEVSLDSKSTWPTPTLAPSR